MDDLLILGFRFFGHEAPEAGWNVRVTPTPVNWGKYCGPCGVTGQDWQPSISLLPRTAICGF